MSTSRVGRGKVLPEATILPVGSVLTGCRLLRWGGSIMVFVLLLCTLHCVISTGCPTGSRKIELVASGHLKVKVGEFAACFKDKCKMHLVRLHLKHQLLAQKDSSCARTCKETPAVTLNTIRKAHQPARKSNGPAAKSLKRPPAGNKTMNGPPAGTDALPASRIELLIGTILSGVVFRIIRV